MSEKRLMVHEVEFLAASAAVAGEPPNERRVVVITIRPDEGSFRPHNIAISRPQAKRLLRSLQKIFARSGILLAALAGLTGCSADVLMVEGCVHFHEHLHVDLNEGDRNSEREVLEVVREWRNGKDRPDDCRTNM